ncbi:hypothetical protein FQR65_LT03386 [Abscondita terminalis]|nr:hypothetical protein FQR65_LT03386 [Abscondita terminalis]
MIKFSVIVLCFHLISANRIRFPVYSYSHAFTDEMEAHASNYPVERYGSYSPRYYPNYGFQPYPQNFQYGRGRFEHHNAYPFIDNRFLGELNDNRFIPHFYNENLFNSKHLNKHLYDKDLENSRHFQHAGKDSGEQFYEGAEGFKDGNLNVKKIKSDLGHYNENFGKKEAAGDENAFQKNTNFKELGNQGEQKNQKSSHTKGHVVKGFKKHHHKDEDAKTEEFYDEAHDEGGNANFGEHLNSFGKNAADSAQGGHNNNNYAAIEKNVGSLHNSGHSLNSNDGGRNKFLGNRRGESVNAFDLRDNSNQHALLENQEIILITKVNCALKFNDKSNIELSKCLNRVINNVFSEDETVLFLPSNSSNYDFLKPITNPHLLFSIEQLQSLVFDNTYITGIIYYSDEREENIDYIMEKTDYEFSANGKWIIVTLDSSISDYFLKLWSHGVNNVVILLYDSNKNAFLRLYNSDPQAIQNNCGTALNWVNNQSCDSKATVEFPKVFRKYSNCSVQYVTFRESLGETSFGYDVCDFFINLITSHLNARLEHIDSEENVKNNFIVVSLILRTMERTSTSVIIYNSKAKWAVPKPKRIPLVQVLKVIFQTRVWIVIAFSFFMAAIIWWFIVKFQNKPSNPNADFALILLNMWESTLFDRSIEFR